MLKDFILLSLLFTAFCVMAYIGLERHESVECQQWENQAKMYNNFYYTDWQKSQCGL